MIEIRPAAADDADGLCDAHVAGWRVGYRGLFPDAFLDAEEFESQRRQRWRLASWLESSDSQMLAALLDGRVVGFAHIGARRATAPAPDEGEVYGFYVHPSAWGTGVAVEMMRVAEIELRERGFTRAVLWVLRDNPRARAFYEKVGWSCSGEEAVFQIENTDPAPFGVAEVLYERSL